MVVPKRSELANRNEIEKEEYVDVLGNIKEREINKGKRVGYEFLIICK